MAFLLDQMLAWVGWRRVFLSIGLGAFMALGHAPTSIFFAPLLAFPMLAWLGATAPTPRTAAWIGWLAGTGYFAVGLLWLVEPFLVDISATGWMAPFALFFMAAGLALFWGAAFYFASRQALGVNMRLLVLACSLILVEFLRSHVLTGFPWGLVAYVWIDTPVAQALSVLGPHGLGLLTLLAALVPVFFRHRIGWRSLGGVLCLALVWGWGSLRTPPPDAVALSPTVVRIVQPNAEQSLKWVPEMRQVFFDRQIMLTKRPRPEEIDVVIWPETALPFYLGDNPNVLQALADAAGPDTQVITGIRRYEQGRYFNALIHLDRVGQVTNTYDKHHLVPFGEYIPFGWLARQLGLRGLAAQLEGFSAGPGPQVLSAAGLPDFLPLICYEAIFPGHVQTDAGRPDWLVHITNDAWFGAMSGPYQHLDQVRARAIEQGLPVARSANTGVSAMIDPYGRIRASLPLNQSGSFDASLPAPLGMPVYAKVGEVPWIGFSLLLLMFSLLRSRRGVSP
jgi:apolipoprotein N-acyltransferase